MLCLNIEGRYPTSTSDLHTCMRTHTRTRTHTLPTYTHKHIHRHYTHSHTHKNERKKGGMYHWWYHERTELTPRCQPCGLSIGMAWVGTHPVWSLFDGVWKHLFAASQAGSPIALLQPHFTFSSQSLWLGRAAFSLSSQFPYLWFSRDTHKHVFVEG